MPSACTSARAGAAPTPEARKGREEPPAVAVGGLVPLTTVDWPGRLSAVVFCQGCPWRCGYCHNPHLIPRAAAPVMAWQDVLAFLERRRGLLDAVVFSGGEPLLQRGLAAAMGVVRNLGFAVGLHTAGAYPERMATLLPRVDWVGFDVKAEFAGYARVTGAAGSGARAREALTVLLEAGTDCEVRTTLDPALVGAEDVDRLADTLSAMGVRRYVLQQCRRRGRALSHPLLDDAAALARLRRLFPTVELRRA